MRAFFMILLGLAGCALLAMGCASTQAAVGACTIASPEWPAAQRDFDRSATLAVLGSLKQVVEEDRAQVHAGQRAQVGERADRLFRAPASATTGFIGHGAMELALRLRQLDCAVARGVLTADVAGPRYDAILVELDAERMALGWMPPTMTAGASPSTGAEVR